MKKVFNMWRMTKDLERRTNTQLRGTSIAVDSITGDTHVLKMYELAFIKDYAKFRQCSQIYAYGILEDCIEEGYIKRHSPSDPSKSNKLLRVTRGHNKGTDLIDTVLGAPTGLVEAIWRKHGRFYAGTFIGIVITSLSSVARIVWKRYTAGR
jgi:hypothetical protein